MSLYDLFKHVFALKGIDPLVDHLLKKWETSLSSTLSKIKPEDEEEAINNLSILIKVLEECKELIEEESCMKIKCVLQEVGNILTRPFLKRSVPILISKTMGKFIKVPYENELDFIINAGSVKTSCYSQNYYALPHEIGHLIFQIKCKNPDLIQSISSKLGETFKKKSTEFDPEKASDVTSIWVLWVNELVADIYALNILGPSYVYYWAQRNTGSALSPNTELGCEKYPPENLRTNWMIRKLNLGRFKNHYDFQGNRGDSDLVPIIRKYNESEKYDMEDEFWSKYQISDDEKRKWRDLIFNDSMFDVIMEIANDVLKKERVDISLSELSESINILKAEKKPQSDILVTFAAILEVRACVISTLCIPKMMILKDIDKQLY